MTRTIISDQAKKEQAARRAEINEKIRAVRAEARRLSRHAFQSLRDRMARRAFLAECRRIAHEMPDEVRLVRHPELLIPGAPAVGAKTLAAARRIFASVRDQNSQPSVREP